MSQLRGWVRSLGGSFQLPGPPALNIVHQTSCPYTRTIPKSCILVPELTLKKILPGNASCLYLRPKIALHVEGAISAEYAVKLDDMYHTFQVFLFLPIPLVFFLFPLHTIFLLPFPTLSSPLLFPPSFPRGQGSIVIEFLWSRDDGGKSNSQPYHLLERLFWGH